MILAAESGGNLPTVIAVIAALAAVASGVVTALVALTNIKGTRKKTSAEADKIAAEASFQGASYVKDLSEAAASLVTPLRSENEKLQARIRLLEERVDELEKKEEDARRKLNRERELSDSSKDAFDTRLRGVMLSYQEEIRILKAQITDLEGQIARQERPIPGNEIA